MTAGDGPESVVLLDEGQDLAAIHLREIQVKQDQIRAGSVDVNAFAPQEGHRFDAVRDDVQVDGRVRIAECFGRQPGVTGAIFDQ